MQLSYSQNPTRALEGMLTDISLYRDVISAIGGASQVIPYGHLVVQDSAEADGVGKLPTLSAEITDGRALGVAMSDVSREADAIGGSANTGYGEGDSIPCIRKGRVWVISEDAVTVVGTPAFARFASGTGTVLGAFRTDADGATAVALPGCTFRTTCGAGELVQLEVSLQADTNTNTQEVSIGEFSVAALAAAQTATDFALGAVAAGVWVAPKAGSLTSISAYLDAALTGANEVDLKIEIDGVGVTPTDLDLQFTVVGAEVTLSATAAPGTSGLTFAADAKIGLVYDSGAITNTPLCVAHIGATYD